MVSPLSSFGSSGIQSQNQIINNILMTGEMLRRSNAPAAASFVPQVVPPPVSAPPAAMMMEVLNMMGQVLQASMKAKQGLANNPNAAKPVTPAPAGPAAPAPAAPAGTPAPAANNNGRLKIVQIDDFNPDNTGFNHGREVGNTIRSSSGGRADVQEIDIGGAGNRSGKIANALSQVIQRAQSGEQIDAINISQQDFQNSGDTQQVRQLIDQLSAMGIPVAVAAGNNGPGQTNQLASNSGFTVASTGANSGTGNVRADGRTTSFATANLVSQLASLKSQGLSLGQIKQQVGAG